MKQGTILLVEDSSDDVELALLAFDRNRIENKVVVAWDGMEALDYLFGMGKHAGRDIQDLPVVVLLDLKLPKLTGLEVLKRIRADERTRLLPVVVLSTSQAESDVRESYQNGANSYIAKPMSYDRFAEVIRHFAEYWLGVNESIPRPGKA
ncbi:MAG: response regulator [Blastocatellia bacterium]|nr:response regulator [Blastocatellia bacterium]